MKVDKQKRTGRMGDDPVTVQISVKLKKPKGAKLAPEVLQQAVDYWAKHGESPRGMDVQVIRWRNPERSGKKGGWRYASTKNERQCKLIRRMLRGTSARVEFTSVG